MTGNISGDRRLSTVIMATCYYMQIVCTINSENSAVCACELVALLNEVNSISTRVEGNPLIQLQPNFWSTNVDRST